MEMHYRFFFLIKTIFRFLLHFVKIRAHIFITLINVKSPIVRPKALMRTCHCHVAFCRDGIDCRGQEHYQ